MWDYKKMFSLGKMHKSKRYRGCYLLPYRLAYVVKRFHVKVGYQIRRHKWRYADTHISNIYEFVRISCDLCYWAIASLWLLWPALLCHAGLFVMNQSFDGLLLACRSLNACRFDDISIPTQFRAVDDLRVESNKDDCHR